MSRFYTLHFLHLKVEDLTHNVLSLSLNNNQSGQAVKILSYKKPKVGQESTWDNMGIGYGRTDKISRCSEHLAEEKFP